MTVLEDLETGVITCAKVIDGVPCPNPLPRYGEEGYHSMRRYCDEHQPRSSTGAAKRRARAAGEETPPASVVNNNFNVKLPPSPKPSASDPLAGLTQAATEMLNLVPLVLSATGDTVCPEALLAAIPAIARQLAVLSTYHPALKKFLTPGESTGEMLTWIGLVVAVSPVLITVLAHHHLISETLAERLASFSTIGAALSTSDGPAH